MIRRVRRREQLLGRHEVAHRRLLTALEKLTGRASPEGAALMIVLASNALHRIEYEDTMDWGERALEVATRVGDRALTAPAAAAISAVGGAVSGSIELAQARRSGAAELIDAMPDEELATRLDAAGHLVGAELYLDRFDDGAARSSWSAACTRASYRSSRGARSSTPCSRAASPRGRRRG